MRRIWAGAWTQGYWRSQERYLNLFARAGDAPVIAEASTFYTQAPLFAHVPERIHGFNPKARFVYVMRDPVERTISHYWHHVRWWGERRPMLRALQAEPHYRHVSHYARQLSAYLRCFERERIYVLTLEALLSDPAAELSRLYAWLGVDAGFRPPTLGVPNNVLPAVIYQTRGYSLVQRFLGTPLYREIAPFIPERLRRAASALIAGRPVRPAEIDVSAVRGFLRPEQQYQTQELARLLNRDFPEWQTLNGCDDSRADPALALDPIP